MGLGEGVFRGGCFHIFMYIFAGRKSLIQLSSLSGDLDKEDNGQEDVFLVSDKRILWKVKKKAVEKKRSGVGREGQNVSDEIEGEKGGT